jgi:hypothetical protein
MENGQLDIEHKVPLTHVRVTVHKSEVKIAF